MAAGVPTRRLFFVCSPNKSLRSRVPSDASQETSGSVRPPRSYSKTAGHSAFHATTLRRTRAISSNVRPSPSRTPSWPLNRCHRRTPTSTYFGSISMP